MYTILITLAVIAVLVIVFTTKGRKETPSVKSTGPIAVEESPILSYSGTSGISGIKQVDPIVLQPKKKTAKPKTKKAANPKTKKATKKTN